MGGSACLLYPLHNGGLQANAPVSGYALGSARAYIRKNARLLAFLRDAHLSPATGDEPRVAVLCLTINRSASRQHSPPCARYYARARPPSPRLIPARACSTSGRGSQKRGLRKLINTRRFCFGKAFPRPSGIAPPAGGADVKGEAVGNGKACGQPPPRPANHGGERQCP